MFFFSASFTMTLPLGKPTVGVLSKVKYKVVCENPTDSGDNPATDIFTVPVTWTGVGACVYALSVSMMSGFKPFHLTLRKDTQVLVWLYTDKDYNMKSQTINVYLAVDDQISVQMEAGSDLADVYNTFSVVKIP